VRENDHIPGAGMVLLPVEKPNMIRCQSILHRLCFPTTLPARAESRS